MFTKHLVPLVSKSVFLITVLPGMKILRDINGRKRNEKLDENTVE
jgi:hypothetical protein